MISETSLAIFCCKPNITYIFNVYHFHPFTGFIVPADKIITRKHTFGQDEFFAEINFIVNVVICIAVENKFPARRVKFHGIFYRSKSGIYGGQFSNIVCIDFSYLSASVFCRKPAGKRMSRL